MRIGLTVVGLLLFAQAGHAGPSWSQLSFTTTASNAPQVLAAADKITSSEVWKSFNGRLLLQQSTADGNDPATHSWVPIYRTAADREAFLTKVQGDPAWTEFLGTLEGLTEPVSTVQYSNLASWGDLNETDDVWIVHAFSVSDAAAFGKAVEDYLKTETGMEFPGQVYLSAVVAGGISPVTHVISVGYDSEAEMEAWVAKRNASADWAAYQQASDPVSEYLGASMARTVKRWGPATLKDLTTP
jgi:hypothetical protein